MKVVYRPKKPNFVKFSDIGIGEPFRLTDGIRVYVRTGLGMAVNAESLTEIQANIGNWLSFDTLVIRLVQTVAAEFDDAEDSDEDQ